ncbi:uncharacterized protein OCT59_005047 [Rhizophagus irregularis]|uniref:uncharacterized protein n=1 Tax=Rhizophagus irregularis TaxID=588596 RepID=UPI00331A83C7|nr:hypothetical protein OCT59_005047 [Rhizophagus irregularis]
MIKDKGVVLPALKEGANSKKLIVKADENTRKYLDRYEASRSRMVNDTELDKSALLSVIIVVEDMTKPQDRKDLNKTEHGGKDDDTDLPADLLLDQKDLIYQEIAYFRERAAARERGRQREEEERANRRAKAEKERERLHGRVNRERENVREKESGITIEFEIGNIDKEEEQRRQAKRKTETEMAFKERERRWQHREEIMATNREREAERDLDVREKPIRDREIMARKLADGTMTLARELAMDEADRLREQQEIELEQHRLQTLEEERKQREEAMEAELNKKF